MKRLTVDDEFKTLISPLAADEYSQLAASIVEEGCRDALVVWNGVILDGHNRYEICQKHGIEFQTVEKPFDSRTDAKIWIIQNQFARRNLNKYQRSMLALELEPLIRARAKANQGTRTDLLEISPKSYLPVDTRMEIAIAAGVSDNTIAKAKNIKKKATKEQKKKLENGEASINKVYGEIRSQTKRQERLSRLAADATKTVSPITGLGKYPVIYGDPPWRYEHNKSEIRAIENHYATMELADICDLRVSEISTDDCILFLWATSPKLAEAIRVIHSWGFNYRTCMVWIKNSIGCGYYVRQRHELLLIATKCKMLTPEPANRPDSFIEWPRGQHSKKPAVVYEIIERMYPELPKVELFARNKRDGWVSWGNEVNVG